MYCKFELNLQRMALTAKAISLWEEAEVKNKVRQYFVFGYIDTKRYTSERKYHPKKNSYGKWDFITKEVLNMIELNVLPAKLGCELIHIVKEIGVKIFAWYEFIFDELGQLKKNLYYTDPIYWTHFGIIDEVKLIKSWLGNSEAYIIGDYKSACKTILKKDISNVWEQMSEDLQELNYSHPYRNYIYHLLPYWKYYRDGNLSKLVNRFEKGLVSDGNVYVINYQYNHSVEENMFELSVREGYSKAVEYFWDKLNTDEKRRSILVGIHLAIQYYDSNALKAYYKLEKYIKIIAFLMSKGSTDQLQKLCKIYNSKLLMIFLWHWPWQEFFIPTFECVCDCSDGKFYCSLINEIVDKICDDLIYFGVKYCKYQKILHQVWYKSPACHKQKIGQCSDIINKLLDIWDLSTLRLIVNDQDMVHKKWSLIDEGYKRYEKFIYEDKYELLDQFIDTILTEEEVSFFKQKIKSEAICEYFIKRNQFDLADKLLNWQCISKEEKKVIKSMIDHVQISQYFLDKEQYELADKFLQWGFESTEEIKNFKVKCKDKLSTDQIYTFWATCKEDFTSAEEKSLKFLSWFLDSEEEIICLKREKFNKNYQLKNILDHKSIKCYRSEIVDVFLEWCLLPKEEINQLKEVLNVDDHKIWSQCYDYISKGCLDVAGRLIKLTFDVEERKMILLRNS